MNPPVASEHTPKRVLDSSKNNATADDAKYRSRLDTSSLHIPFVCADGT